MPRRLIHLGRMLRAERMDRVALMRLQDRLLQRLINHAFAHVPAYRQLWSEAGVAPGDVRGIQDLYRLPILSKREIRKRGRELFIDERRDSARLIALSTSGSSGAPFELLVDPTHNLWRKAQRLRPYVSNGLRPQDRSMILTSRSEARATWFNRLGVLREERQEVGVRPSEMLDTLLRVQPDVLVGYPSALSALAGAYMEAGARARPPRLVFSDSEMLTPSIRLRVQEAFGRDPIDVFGTFETENIAFQCEARNGYHVAAESAIVEVVGPDGSSACGTPGDVVVTVLRSLSMPFIRYNLGDSAVLQEGPCPCGRTLPLLSVVHGRTEDQFILPDGAAISAHSLAFGFADLHSWIREYCLVQRSPSEVLVLVDPMPAFGADALDAIASVFAKHMPGVAFEVEMCPGGIPRGPSGKLRRVVRAFDQP